VSNLDIVVKFLGREAGGGRGSAISDGDRLLVNGRCVAEWKSGTVVLYDGHGTAVRNVVRLVRQLAPMVGVGVGE